MLDRAHRFHGYNALNQAYKQGQTVRGTSLGLKYYLNPRRRTFRVAVVVSRKVSKSAVTRNRIRRRVYEIVRQQVAHSSQPYDLIFTAYTEDLATMETANLTQLVSNQLAKAGVTTTRQAPDHAIVSTEEETA